MKKLGRALKLLFMTPIHPTAIARGLALYFFTNVLSSFILNFVPWWVVLPVSTIFGMLSMLAVGHILTFGEQVAKHKKEVKKKWMEEHLPGGSKKES